MGRGGSVRGEFACRDEDCGRVLTTKAARASHERAIHGMDTTPDDDDPGNLGGMVAIGRATMPEPSRTPVRDMAARATAPRPPEPAPQRGVEPAGETGAHDMGAKVTPGVADRAPDPPAPAPRPAHGWAPGEEGSVILTPDEVAAVRESIGAEPTEGFALADTIRETDEGELRRLHKLLGVYLRLTEAEAPA